MRSAFRKISVSMIPVIAIFLAGCASTSSDKTGTTIDKNTCTENLYFFDHNERIRYSTCEQFACGEPLETGDVLVVKINDGKSLEAVVDAKAGSTARYVDQWYLAGDLTTDNYLNSVKQALAAKGCNLLIVGDQAWPRKVNPNTGSTRSLRTQFRWGGY